MTATRQSLTNFTVLSGGMWSAMKVVGAFVPQVWQPKFLPRDASACLLASDAYSSVAGREADSLKATERRRTMQRTQHAKTMVSCERQRGLNGSRG